MPELSTLRPLYYTRTTRPHVWAVMERHADNRNPEKRPCSDLDLVIEWVGAKQHRGDQNAREYARATCERLNRLAVKVIEQLSLDDSEPRGSSVRYAAFTQED